MPSTNTTLAHCNASGRGYPRHQKIGHSLAPIAEEGLKQIADLFPKRGYSADERLATRQQKSAPKIVIFKTWLNHTRTQVSVKSPAGEALKYIAKYWGGLILFLPDGRIEMDNNAVERTIRPIALQRRNALFAGSDAGAQNRAMLAPLIETCKLNQIEPHSNLTRVLTATVNCTNKNKSISCCRGTSEADATLTKLLPKRSMYFSFSQMPLA